MKTIEVSQNQWANFCERLTQQHREALVTVQTEDGEGKITTLMQDKPLRALRLDDRSDPCNTLLILETGLAAEKGSEHRVIDPLHIRLKDGSSDHYTRIQILGENGATILTMHPGIDLAAAMEFSRPAAR
ncbi:MAG TPA: hypothetical protein VHH88_06555 [Verrucomicrobiae bacterium]|nr:hypothetical protein [Verrucomicrobiae bacterium]